jgi:hypothetical protein
VAAARTAAAGDLLQLVVVPLFSDHRVLIQVAGPCDQRRPRAAAARLSEEDVDGSPTRSTTSSAARSECRRYDALRVYADARPEARAAREACLPLDAAADRRVAANVKKKPGRRRRDRASIDSAWRVRCSLAPSVGELRRVGRDRSGPPRLVAGSTPVGQPRSHLVHGDSPVCPPSSCACSETSVTSPTPPHEAREVVHLPASPRGRRRRRSDPDSSSGGVGVHSARTR